MTALRAASPDDYDRIIAVVDDWWGREIHDILPRLFLDHFHRTSLVAEDGGDLAGFLVGFMSPSLPEAAYIHFVGVRPAFRGTGLGRRLYEAFFAMAAADGRSSVGALTSPQNTGSVAFHEAMGFVATLKPEYDGPGTPRVVFKRAL